MLHSTGDSTKAIFPGSTSSTLAHKPTPRTRPRRLWLCTFLLISLGREFPLAVVWIVSVCVQVHRSMLLLTHLSAQRVYLTWTEREKAERFSVFMLRVQTTQHKAQRHADTHSMSGLHKRMGLISADRATVTTEPTLNTCTHFSWEDSPQLISPPTHTHTPSSQVITDISSPAATVPSQVVWNHIRS